MPTFLRGLLNREHVNELLGSIKPPTSTTTEIIQISSEHHLQEIRNTRPQNKVAPVEYTVLQTIVQEKRCVRGLISTRR